MAPYGYYPSKRTPGLWLHKTRKISFTLVVDDFGVKYIKKSDANHLFNSIKTKYPLKVDWEGKKYLGIDLDWNYDKKQVVLSMKGYNPKALKEFGHKKPNKPVYGPSQFTRPEYGKKIQYAKNDDDSPTLSPKEIKTIQKIAGKFLYSGRAVDSTIMHTLNEINIEANKATEKTKAAVKHFLDYIATNPEAKIIYRASDMQLQVDSDAAYLVEPKARSRAGGYHFLGNLDGKLFNGPIFILAKVIKAVMSSAAESECGSLYMNARETIPFIITLEELGHKQLAVPIKTDNSTAKGIMNKEIKQKRSKSFDMRFWWLVDRTEQGLFRIYWAPGYISLADYFTKKTPRITP